MNTVSILMTRGTMANIKYDSRKHFSFLLVHNKNNSKQFFIYVLTQKPKGKLKINIIFFIVTMLSLVHKL